MIRLPNVVSRFEMGSKSKLSPFKVLKAIQGMAEAGYGAVSSTDVIEAIVEGNQGSSATVRRHLNALCEEGLLVRYGRARATRYSLVQHVIESPSAEYGPAEPRVQPQWSPQSISLLHKLNKPLAARNPVTYQRDFVDAYVPNTSCLIPRPLADRLVQAGRLRDQQPAGTYARKVLEQLLIDLSWASSRLEGNQYSLLATAELFRRGNVDGDADAVMLMNHKMAIEFIVDTVPFQGLSSGLIKNLHTALMQDLLEDVRALGTIRQKVVNISDTVYLPTQVPALLGEMLEIILEKARLIKNPLESAFFLWVNLAYLQPFEDGNKRTSRLAANIPLMLYNCAPLSFQDVDPLDYAKAMMGVYEFQDISLAVDLFCWTYERSMNKYVVIMNSMGAPNPLRVRYRQRLADAVTEVVHARKPALQVLREFGLTEENAPQFKAILMDELQHLQVYNCARFRLDMSTVQHWIEDGRPS
jgi:fido (protein-threonine AMPylation protein)